MDEEMYKSIVDFSTNTSVNKIRKEYTLTEGETTIVEDQDVGNLNILVPFAVFVSIILLSALVYLMAKNRRRLAHIYYNRNQVTKPVFNEEDPSDLSIENEDNFIDDPTRCLLKGKLQISQPNYLTT